MTTIGFKNVPFTVHIAMHAAIHAVHYVNLNNGGDGRMTFPGGGNNMIFTPLNWATPQDIVVNFNGVGDAELMADVTNDYFVDGTGAHRSVRFIVDLSVTALPLDVWVGSLPGLTAGVGGGDLAISHNNVLAGHRAAIGISSGSVVGFTFDSPFQVTSGTTIQVTDPVGAVSIITGSGVLSFSMPLLGVYQFKPLMPFCLVVASDVLGHVVQQQDFEFTVTDAGGGTIVVPTVTKTSVKSQGIAVASTAIDYTDFTPAPNGTPVADTTYPIGGTTEDTVVGAWTLRDLGPVFNSNCSGGSAAVVGKTVVISGVTPGGSPGSGFNAAWSYALVNGGFIPTVAGVDCIPVTKALVLERKGICA